MLYAKGQGRYDGEYERLWKTLMPASGQVLTIQGELVRAIGRLASEAYRNGNCNWDGGFEIFVEFLRENLHDATIFDQDTLDELHANLDFIRNAGQGGADLELEEGEDAYDRVTDRVVEWRHEYPRPIARQADPRLHR
jgi:hypothetical protein